MHLMIAQLGGQPSLSVRPAGDEGDVRQDLPPDWRFLPEAWRTVVLDTGIAVAKSAEILAGGLQLMNSGVFGMLSTTVDDAFVGFRAQLTCRSTASLLALDRDVALRGWTDFSVRLSRLGRMAGHVCDDVTYPLRRRVDIAFELLARSIA